MPVLAYCITEPEPQIKVPEAGVHGNPIASFQESGLRCFVSDYSPQPSDKPVRETALAFSRVLQEIFRQAAIIPFCFPTLMDDQAEMVTFVREHAADYREDLNRLRNFVQMEVQISFQPGEAKRQPGQQSGKDYLRSRLVRQQKLEAAVQEFRRPGDPHIQDWRQRYTPTGIRGYALVERVAVPAFLETVGGVTLGSELHARVTGPWPATEFFKENYGGQ